MTTLNVLIYSHNNHMLIFTFKDANIARAISLSQNGFSFYENIPLCLVKALKMEYHGDELSVISNPLYLGWKLPLVL